ncbi:MAG: sulfotransferase [Chitinophagales bacterium]|nr:sulfotransferase [Chitinophagales bacterium]
MNFSNKFIFIVGNSRSGTTLMLRVLNQHPQLMVLNELHFFEQLWSSKDKDKIISESEAIVIAEKLLLIQRKGYNTGFNDTTVFTEEAKSLINSIDKNELTAENVFYQFAKREVALNNKSIVCEKTPQNVFYLKEIFDLFPNAKVINMVRDPRAIMLSQKNKWKRRKLGGWYITRKESIRLRINYHPITLSKLWNAAIKASLEFKNNQAVKTIIFENLIDNPTQTIQSICNHIEVDFTNKMLEITQESSSIEMDSKAIGFKKERAANWKNGGLNNTEIWFCEKISGKYFSEFGFEKLNPKPNYLLVILYIILFPIKLGLALLMNLDRMKSITETLKKRLQ